MVVVTVPECTCGDVVSSMDRFVDHLSDQHGDVVADVARAMGMPECQCGHVASSGDRAADHIHDEHGELLDGVVDAMLVGDAE